MQFGIPKEQQKDETRIAIVPDTAKQLIKKGHQVSVEKTAGEKAYILDREFEAVGAKILSDAKSVYSSVDCILKVHAPTPQELDLMGHGKALIGFLWPLRNPEIVQDLARRKLTSFSMDAIPRISRAQSMDALSSMATIAGYKAVLLATQHLVKFFPMLTTAAGTIRPAQGLIIGAGVAGLQAIATARRLGAVVSAFDARAAVKEQIQSLGATFVELKDQTLDAEGRHGYAKQVSSDVLVKQQELILQQAKNVDFIISTAQVPGGKAPVLITRQAVLAMKPGSVIVDLATETGGNCELSKKDQVVVESYVTICGPTNLPATLPLDASRMYARNMLVFINEIINDKGFTFDWNNEVFSETCLTYNGEINTKRGKK